MGELRAAIDGFGVRVTFDDPDELSPPLRAALIELADAMYEQQAQGAEVEGFGFDRLVIGDLLNPTGKFVPVPIRNRSCWGYDTGEGHCTWNSDTEGSTVEPELKSCTIHSTTKK